MPRTKTVSEKSTKSEILDAYRGLLTEAQGTSTEITPEAKEEKVTVDAAARETVEKITTDLSNLKLSVNGAITQLSERLTTEAERLSTILRAIQIAEKQLEEREKIKVTVGMFQRLLEVKKQKEEEMDRQIATKRAQWEEEQREYEKQVTRERTRDEEEYEYQKKLQKQRDTDERLHQSELKAKAEALEVDKKKELLTELETLRKKVAQFPQELDIAQKKAVGQALADAKRESGVAAQLANQQSDAALNIAQLKIDSLESTVKSQAAEVARLNRELAEATRQVKDIAVSIVEGQRKEPTSQVRSNQDTAK